MFLGQRGENLDCEFLGEEVWSSSLIVRLGAGEAGSGKLGEADVLFGPWVGEGASPKVSWAYCPLEPEDKGRATFIFP